MSTPDDEELKRQTRMLVAAAPQACACFQCEGKLAAMDEVLIDMVEGRIYCYQCGVRLRYHRKRALQRGEEIPTTIADVDRRIQQLMQEARP